MAQTDKPSVIDKVKGIAGDAQKLAAELKPKAEQGANLTKKELDAIRKLVQRSEAAMSDANQRAKERRQQEIKALEELIQSITSALGTPGLSANARNDLKNLRRRRRAQLLHLQTRAALDFGGILTANQIKEIAELLKRAKQEVANKKKAAAFLTTVVRIADIALSVGRKVGGAL